MDPEKADENLELGLSKAEGLGIARLLEPEDLLQGKVNERIIILYISYFYNAASGMEDPAPEPAVDHRDEEIAYLKKEVERLVGQLQALKSKYESLRLRSKEETEYLIEQQKGLMKQLEKMKKSRTKLEKKMNTLQSKMKFMEDEKQQATGTPPPEGPVTLVCTAVQGSGKLWDTFPEEMANAISLHNVLIRGLSRELEGYEVRIVLIAC
tara:strand:- start:307 stop:936 length:630 start_codon:yes stop_codon:yes gene_type:complete